MKNANYWIEKLSLQVHPEGGFFKENYRSNEFISKDALPDRFSGDRTFSTSIYFLLDKDQYSAFHRIKQDEIWHFYDGCSLTIHIIDPVGNYSTVILGKDIDNDENLQIIVPAGCFFAAEINNKNSFSLSGCTVAPGFDFADFEMPKSKVLLELFPQHEKIITNLT